MKKLLLILLCLPMIGFGQVTYLPDDNFEAYLEANGMGNGIPNDDYVTTANINIVSNLYVNNQNIADLTGIEDFTALTQLYCHANQLTSLDVSQNIVLTNLGCHNNQLTSLDVSQNIVLTNLGCHNNQLTSLDVSANTALTQLYCNANQLTSLDVSTNTNLIELDCYNNQLTSLDVRNGNNINMRYDFPDSMPGISVYGNPSLTCIDVDNSIYCNANWGSYMDPQHYYSDNCPPSAIQENTTNKELLKVTDLLGRETKQTNQPLFYIYDDGTVEKRIVIEQ
jgi:Leucine-rich repeat (LRR) protein